jgi:hypothetical protein
MLLRIRRWLRHEAPWYLVGCLVAIPWAILLGIGEVAERLERLQEAWVRLRHGPVVDDDDERYGGEPDWPR